MGWVIALVLLALPALGSAAEQQQPQRPAGQAQALGRATKPDDPVPVFDFEQYFTGRWAFEWTVPDGPFGPGGTITGVEEFKPGVDGRFFESEIVAEGPQGPFTVHAQMLYNPEGQFLVRHETDSRGFSVIKAGTIKGDLGGYYTAYYESAPFEYNGKTIQLKMTTILFSPLNFKVRAQISEDGGPFVNFGNPWWRKETQGSAENRP